MDLSGIRDIVITSTDKTYLPLGNLPHLFINDNLLTASKTIRLFVGNCFGCINRFYFFPSISFVQFQDESSGEITFYMKGADVAMSTIVQYNDWLEEEVRNKIKIYKN